MRPLDCRNWQRTRVRVSTREEATQHHQCKQACRCWSHVCIFSSCLSPRNRGSTGSGCNLVKCTISGRTKSASVPTVSDASPPLASRHTWRSAWAWAATAVASPTAGQPVRHHFCATSLLCVFRGTVPATRGVLKEYRNPKRVFITREKITFSFYP